MQLQLREYQKQDFKPLETIIRQTWHYDDFCSPKIAAKLARTFLSSCLTNYTFSRVAVMDGEITGIILVKDIKQHRCPLRHRLKQIQSLISLYLTSEGRSASKIFEQVDKIDHELLQESNKSYPAELALFAVSESCRGMGIGKKLFESALNYIHCRKFDDFYLFTDTSCNYGFYEHQGMSRTCEKEHHFQMKGQDVKMNFFLYDYEF